MGEGNLNAGPPGVTLLSKCFTDWAISLIPMPSLYCVDTVTVPILHMKRTRPAKVKTVDGGVASAWLSAEMIIESDYMQICWRKLHRT